MGDNVGFAGFFERCFQACPPGGKAGTVPVLLFDKSAFEELEEARIPNPQSVDKEALVAFFGSMGWIAELPDERRTPLLDEVRSLLAAPEYALPWETRVYWARLAK